MGGTEGDWCWRIRQVQRQGAFLPHRYLHAGVHWRLWQVLKSKLIRSVNCGEDYSHHYRRKTRLELTRVTTPQPTHSQYIYDDICSISFLLLKLTYIKVTVDYCEETAMYCPAPDLCGGDGDRVLVRGGDGLRLAHPPRDRGQPPAHGQSAQGTTWSTSSTNSA